MNELRDTQDEVVRFRLSGQTLQPFVVYAEDYDRLLAANREQKAQLSAALAEHGKTLLSLNKAAFETIPALEAEQKAEIERLTKNYQTLLDDAVEMREQLASLRASVGEKWIDVKQELPPANKNHCWLAWITSQNKNGGYIDLVSYGEYICFNEECHEGDANYVEHDDGNMKRDGWYREEETHGGEFDYIFVDLNDKVTHWQPLPVAPTLPGEEK